MQRHGSAPGVNPTNGRSYVGHDSSCGYSRLFLNSKVYDVGVFTLFLFQMGSWIRRRPSHRLHGGKMSFKSFLISPVISMFVYPSSATGSGRRLARHTGTEFHLGHGHVDFAGSSSSPWSAVWQLSQAPSSSAPAWQYGPNGEITPSRS